MIPVAFRYNPEIGAIDIGGHRFTERETFRDVQRTGVAALHVEDAKWRVACIPSLRLYVPGSGDSARSTLSLAARHSAPVSRPHSSQ